MKGQGEEEEEIQGQKKERKRKEKGKAEQHFPLKYPEGTQYQMSTELEGAPTKSNGTGMGSNPK